MYRKRRDIMVKDKTSLHHQMIESKNFRVSESYDQEMW